MLQVAMQKDGNLKHDKDSWKEGKGLILRIPRRNIKRPLQSVG